MKGLYFKWIMKHDGFSAEGEDDIATEALNFFAEQFTETSVNEEFPFA